MIDLTIKELYKNTEELSKANQWKATRQSRLKHLGEEVMELATTETDDTELVREGFDVIWNVLDYLRISGWQDFQIEAYFRDKMKVNAGRTWAGTRHRDGK